MDTASSKGKILIVEDEMITAKGIEKTLLGFGYDVVGIASDAERGLELVIAKEPDVILMDITLNGETDGISLAQRIKTFSDTPIIYLTAHTDFPTIKSAVDTNPFGYLRKPFDDVVLNNAIKNTLGRYRMNRELPED